MKTLSTIWLIIRSSPKAMYYVSLALYYLPTILPLVAKLREAFGSEQVQAVFKAWSEFIDRVAPPAPTADSAGEIPANREREKRWRFTRFMNRTRIAGQITDNEVQNICDAKHIKPYNAEVTQWT